MRGRAATRDEDGERSGENDAQHACITALVRAISLPVMDTSAATGTAAPLLAAGGPQARIERADLDAHVHELAEHVVSTGACRVLLVPPDQTRLYSFAGEITGGLYELLARAGVHVEVLPATGTHHAMDAADQAKMFRGHIPPDRVRAHDWRDDVVELGELPEEEVDELLGRPFGMSLPLQVATRLVEGGHDLVVAAGQVVPHEVAGVSGFGKLLCIGLGGRATIDRTHFLSAVHGIEQTMGRVDNPVRIAIDRLFDRFLAPLVPTLWAMTVVEDAEGGPALRGLFFGEGGSSSSGGAAFRAATDLALSVNVHRVDEPFRRCVVRLDPDEFHSTWVGNKAIYRTRMAMADGGELVVLAPALDRFGEDGQIDALIRRHGYRGTEATLAALDADPELRANLAAAAHLIHGSTEGRFTVTLCPGPGLTREEVEGVGFSYRPYAEAQDEPVDIRNPALGLWAA